jgi:exonuclease SbcC
MFIIKSIRLRNFRAVAEARLEPLDNGITGIFGTNGAGKTTFLIGALFALFGERPRGSTVASLRRDGSDYDDECSVSIVVEHLGQTIEVLREIKGKANKGEVYIYVDGIEHSTTSVGEAESWIRMRFGINAEGFKTAFVVKQKELDSLVSALPSERKKLIEKLAGIEDMNQALIDVRKDENDLKKQLDVLPGSFEAFTTAEELYSDSQHDFRQVNDKFAIAQESLKQSEVNYDKINSAYVVARGKISYIEGLSSRIKNRKTELVELGQRLIVAESRLSGITEADVTRLSKEFVALDNNLTAKREEFTTLRITAADAQKNVANLKIQIADIESLAKPEEVIVSSADLEIQLSELEVAYNEKKISVARLGVEKENLNNNLDMFSHNECPTCHREWENTVEEKDKATHAIADIEASISALQIEIAELTRQAETVKNQISATRKLEQDILTYARATANLDNLKTKLVTAQSALVLDSALETIKEAGKALSTERDAKQSALNEAKSALQFKVDVDSLKEKIKTSNVEIPKLEAELAQENKAAPDIVNIEQELREAREALDEERSSFNQANETLNAFNITYYGLKNNYENQKKLWEKKKDVQRKHQEVAAQTDLIERFRLDSVGRLAPELSSYATSFISEMTSGAFTEILLTDDFSPSVITSVGKERPVSWLSGGEESAVALALRLAISFLITKENPQMLWLDEVLTAQDADRRGSMLGMIRRLPISQVLIINHTQEASDIVDKVITLVPDTTNGSTIQEI